MFKEIIIEYICLVRFPCLSGFHMLANFLQPNLQTKPQREGTESEQFWDLLGGKSEYPSQKINREAESDPHLFCCNFSKGKGSFSSLLEIYPISLPLLKANSWLACDGFLPPPNWTMSRKFKGEYTHWSISCCCSICTFGIYGDAMVWRHIKAVLAPCFQQYFICNVLSCLSYKENLEDTIHFKH